LKGKMKSVMKDREQIDLTFGVFHTIS